MSDAWSQRSAAEAQAVVDRYPENARVSAFVDPQDPNTAYLEKRWSEMPYVAMSIGCLPMVFVAGLGIVAAGWKRPGVALLCGLGVGAAVIILLVITGGHYLRHVPTSERHWSIA